ncbi:MAG: hypothetical protein Q8K55_01025 [Gemmatimonadaceae bacterium]|nr:hypothetical protein [Gemmatimonadaceae bacterium]
MADKKKTTTLCPNCDGEAECCCCQVQEGVVSYDAYTRWCPRCHQRETVKRQAGYKIASIAYSQPTTCPFCGKPASEHPKGVSLGAVCQEMGRRAEEGEPPQSPSKTSGQPN